MRLFDCENAPSPRRVRVFLAEKGIELERVQVDLGARAQHEPAYLAVNPTGLVPALALDDGTVIADSLAICRYLDRLHPEPALFGQTPLEEARILAAVRMIEEHGYNSAVLAYRNTHRFFEGRAVAGRFAPTAQIPALVDRARIVWDGFMARLDARLAEGEWVSGDRFGYADVTGLVTVDFGRRAGLPIPGDRAHVARWHAAMAARPGAVA